MRVLALSAIVMAAACIARVGEVAANGAHPPPADSQPRENPEKLERLRLRNERVEAQKLKPLEGLTEDELFDELARALSVDRENAALWKINLKGSLQAADRLDERAARIRAGEMHDELPPNASTLEYFAQEIRFRHTSDRKYRVQALLIVTNPADETFGALPSSSRASEIVRQGIVEARGNLVALVDRDRKKRAEYWRDRDIEITRRAIMLLDIWAEAKTPEETFVRAVEQEEYLPLKPCGVDLLLGFDQVSDSTRQRVKKALMPRAEAAMLRAKKLRTARETEGANGWPTSEESAIVCALYGFWAKHSTEEARGRWNELYIWCGHHYEVGSAVSDRLCP